MSHPSGSLLLTYAPSGTFEIILILTRTFGTSMCIFIFFSYIFPVYIKSTIMQPFRRMTCGSSVLREKLCQRTKTKYTFLIMSLMLTHSILMNRISKLFYPSVVCSVICPSQRWLWPMNLQAGVGKISHSR